MAFKKYLQDYTMEMQTDARGKRKRVPVYHGVRYDFIADRDTVRRKGRFAMALCLVSALIFIIMLLIPGVTVSYLAYACIPVGLLIFPVGYSIASCVHILWAKEYLTREQSDKSCTRLRVCTGAQCVLCVAGFTGAVIGICQLGVRLGNIVWCAGELCMLACGILVFRASPAFKTKIVEAGDLPEAKAGEQ